MNESEIVSVKVPGIDRTLRFVRSPHPEFWTQFVDGVWEPETLSILVGRLGPSSKYVDVGAWIGPTCLVAAACGADVTAFEPDPVARAFLEQNLALNDQLMELVTIVPAALAAEEGEARLSSDNLGDSMSSLVRRAETAVPVTTVDARSWSNTAAFLSADLMKVDVEGFEFRLIPRMAGAFRTHRPTLLLSVHGYVFRRRFAHTLPLVARVLRRATSAWSRLRLLVALRRFGNRWVFSTQQHRWLPLRGKVRVVFLASLSDTELLVSDDGTAGA